MLKTTKLPLSGSRSLSRPRLKRTCDQSGGAGASGSPRRSLSMRADHGEEANTVGVPAMRHRKPGIPWTVSGMRRVEHDGRDHRRAVVRFVVASPACRKQRCNETTGSDQAEWPGAVA